MKKVAALLAILALAGCASTGGKSEEPADFATLISQAEAAQKKAKSVGGEWRDTGDLIKDAKEANEKGDAEKAMSLAKRAKFESEMGIKQAESQAKAGPWLF